MGNSLQIAPGFWIRINRKNHRRKITPSQLGRDRNSTSTLCACPSSARIEIPFRRPSQRNPDRNPGDIPARPGSRSGADVSAPVPARPGLHSDGRPSSPRPGSKSDSYPGSTRIEIGSDGHPSSARIGIRRRWSSQLGQDRNPRDIPS